MDTFRLSFSFCTAISSFLRKRLTLLLFFSFFLILIDDAEAGKRKRAGGEEAQQPRAAGRAPAPKQPRIGSSPFGNEPTYDAAFFAEIAKLESHHAAAPAGSSAAPQPKATASEPVDDILPPEFLAAINAAEANYLAQLTARPQRAELSSGEAGTAAAAGGASPAQHPRSVSSNGKAPSVQRGRAVEQRDPVRTCRIDLVCGREEHTSALLQGINTAKNEILVTSQSIRFLPQDIYDAFRSATERGVHVRVFFNDSIPESVQTFFEDQEVACEQLNIHGKHLIIDRKFAIVGSFNWLDLTEEDLESSYDGSESEDVFNGEYSVRVFGNESYINRLRGAIYSELISYSHLSSYDKLYEGSLIPLSLDLSRGSRLLLLTTLRQHEEYLRVMCREATKRIVIFSPFFTYQNARKRYETLTQEIKPGVTLDIYMNKEDAPKLARFVKRQRFKSNIRVIEEFFHHKTLIVDDDTVSTGSFNWFSAAQSMGSEGHNQESSLVIQGSEAKKLIDEVLAFEE